MLAHFGAYTYVRPFLEAVPQAGPGTITALLLAYGATGILGDFLGGAALARRPHAAFGAIAALLAAAIALLPVLGDGTVGAALLLVLWDTAYGARARRLPLGRHDPGRSDGGARGAGHLVP